MESSQNSQELQESRKEIIHNKRRKIAQNQIYRYPTKNKKYKTVSQLRDAIEAFFEEYNSRNVYGTIENIPLPSDLSLFLGYSSYRQMANEINNPNDPEYSYYLERAVDYINNNLMRSQLTMAVATKNLKGIDNVVNYFDKINDSTVKKEDKKADIQININMEGEKRVNAFISNQMDKILCSIEQVQTPSKAQLIEADYDMLGEESDG